MKVCPVCGIEYSDKAKFCKKCEAALIDKPEPQEKIPTNYKRLFLMILFTFLFIGFIAVLYMFFGRLLLR